MKKLLLIVSISFCLQTKAQTFVTIPDANFVTYLQSVIPSAMSGNQLNTSSTLVTTTTKTLSIGGKSISNLYGVQFFTSLVDLECWNNQLTSLPSLPGTLKNLSCGGNLLTALPALPNTLQDLRCSARNTFGNLPTLPTSLTHLECATLSLTTLPALPPNLTYFDCSENSITSLPVLPSSLLDLECAYNLLTSLPALPNGLTRLDCHVNRNLNNLPTLPDSLFYLQCELNNLTTLPTLPNKLNYLYCDRNNITCFPTFPASITTFSVDPNLYNCFPNYIPAMSTAQLATPLCAAGNTNGCPIAVTGILNYTAQQAIKIYPNPAQNNFTIETSSADKQNLFVYDVNGKQVLTQVINGVTSIDVRSLAAGVYNVSITNTQGIVIKRLVIVK